MEIVNVNVDEIKPYWRNPRKNEEAIKQVKLSIQRYGFNVPLVLDQDGVIITGHTRYKALLELGAKAVPCVYSEMDAKKAKEYRIADNKTGELAHWDIGNLKLEMREMDIIGAMPGFTELEMGSLLKDITFNTITPGSEAEVPQTVTSGQTGVMGSFKKANALSGPSGDAEREGFAKKEEELDNRFKAVSDERQDNYLQVACPHCAGEFVIDKRELLN